MHLRPVLLLAFAPSFGRIRASGSLKQKQPNVSPLSSIPTVNSTVVSSQGVGSVEDVAPIFPDAELERLSGFAEKAQHLGVNVPEHRLTLPHILEDIRVIIKKSSKLSPNIPSSTAISTLQQLATRFEATFLECASLSSSFTWHQLCMAALVGEDTFVKLLPHFSVVFADDKKLVMLDGAIIAGNFDAFQAVHRHFEVKFDTLKDRIKDQFFLSGSREFVEKVLEFVPRLMPIAIESLPEAARLDDLSIFWHIYKALKKPPVWPQRVEESVKDAVVALASRGQEGPFKMLHFEHPECLDAGSCLIAAARHGRANILNYLLYQHADLAEKSDSCLYTAFEAAVGNGYINAMSVLLDYDKEKHRGASRLSLTRLNKDILRAVGDSGRWEGIDYLMELKDDGDVRFAKFELRGDAGEAVERACQHGHLQVLGKLLQKDPQGQFMFTFEDPHEMFRASLKRACENGHVLVVQELLRKDKNGHYVHQGIDPTARDNLALILACRNGHLPVVKELLRKDENGNYVYQGINPAASENWALIVACENGQLPVVKELLRKDEDGNYVYRGIDPAAVENSALVAACENGHLPVVQELLRKDDNGNYVYQGIDPAAKDNQALFFAYLNGRLPVVQELLRKDENGNYIYQGIDPAAMTKALFFSARNKQLSVVQELLRKDKNGNYIYPVPIPPP